MITPTGALILLVPVLPIALWAVISDLKQLKIRNNTVLAMAGIWLALGWLAVPTWSAYAWGIGFLVIGVLLAFLANAFLNFPGGDGKYAAAITPFFVGADPVRVAIIVICCMIAAPLLLQVVRALPPVKRATIGWEGFRHWRIVPFGLALSMMVVYYLGAAIWPQA